MADPTFTVLQLPRPSAESFERGCMLVQSVSAMLFTLEQLAQEVASGQDESGATTHAIHELLQLTAWKADLALKALGRTQVSEIDALKRLLAPGERVGLVHTEG